MHPYMVATPSRRSVSSYVGSLRPPSRRLDIYTLPFLHLLIPPYLHTNLPICLKNASTHPWATISEIFFFKKNCGQIPKKKKLRANPQKKKIAGKDFFLKKNMRVKIFFLKNMRVKIFRFPYPIYTREIKLPIDKFVYLVKVWKNTAEVLGSIPRPRSG